MRVALVCRMCHQRAAVHLGEQPNLGRRDAAWECPTCKHLNKTGFVGRVVSVTSLSDAPKAS